MFEYLSLYRRHAKGQHGKVLGFTILQMILCIILPSILMFALMFAPALLSFTNTDDSTIGVAFIVWGLVISLVFVLACIFLIFPMYVGILRYFASAYTGKPFSFGEAYKVFKKGNYSKLIKIALLVFLLYLALSIVIGILINMLFVIAITPLAGAGFVTETTQLQELSVPMIILSVALALIVTIVAYIPYIIMFIYFAVVFMVYIDEPLIPTMDKLKIAWDILFKSSASMVKLFFSNLILYIVMMIVMFAVIFGLAFLVSFTAVQTDIPGLSAILGFVVLLITFVIGVYVSYLILGSIVAYYFVGRESLDEINHQEKRELDHQIENDNDLQ